MTEPARPPADDPAGHAWRAGPGPGRPVRAERLGRPSPGRDTGSPSSSPGWGTPLAASSDRAASPASAPGRGAPRPSVPDWRCARRILARLGFARRARFRAAALEPRGADPVVARLGCGADVRSNRRTRCATRLRVRHRPGTPRVGARRPGLPRVGVRRPLRGVLPPTDERRLPPKRVEPVPGTPFGVVHLDVPPVTSGLAVGALVAGIASILVSLLVICFGLVGAGRLAASGRPGRSPCSACSPAPAAIVAGLLGQRQIRRPARTARGPVHRPRAGRSPGSAAARPGCCSACSAWGWRW